MDIPRVCVNLFVRVTRPEDSCDAGPCDVRSKCEESDASCRDPGDGDSCNPLASGMLWWWLEELLYLFLQLLEFVGGLGKGRLCEVEEATRLCILHHSGFEFRAVSWDGVPVFLEDCGDVVEVRFEMRIQLRKGQQECSMVVPLCEDDSFHLIEHHS